MAAAIGLAMIASLLAVPTRPATAATTPPPAPDLEIVVNDTGDGAGGCSVGSESCTLRAAIETANNAAPGVTTIEVPAGYYLLENGPLVIVADNTFIFGAFSPFSASPTLIDANGARAFDIAADGVTLAGLAISNADAGNHNGGAVSVNGGADNFVLVQSSLYNNAARQGGGLHVEGSARIEQSAFFGNTAGQKGGGIRVSGRGTLTLRNSTFTQNGAQSGGAISVAGSASVSFSTFVDNSSSNENGAGVDRNGGTVTVTASILTQSNQQDAPGSDCSGNPDLIGVNYLGNAQGCNPGPDAIVSDSSDPTTALVLGPLAANGGPTETIALFDGSLGAIDRTSCTDVDGGAVTVDQREIARPTADCDLGAFEIVPLSVDMDLDVDVTNYTADPYDLQDPGVPGPEVGVGVVSVPIDNILPELLGRNEPNTGIGPEDTALNSVALNSVALNSVALNSVALNSVALNSVALALEALALNSVALNSVALNSVALNSVKLSDIPLLLPGGWEAFLVGTAFEDFPIQSVTLGDLTSENVDLNVVGIGDLDLSSSALNSVALHAVLLADTALNSVALNSVDAGNADAWCIFLGAELCDPADEEQVAALGELTLLSLEFVEGVPPIPLFDIPMAAALNSVALNSVALNSVAIHNTALNSVALNSVALNSVGNSISVDCGRVDCDTATLGQALAADAVASATTIGDLLAAIDPEVLDSFSLADLLLAFLAVEEVPFESIDLESALLQNVADPLQPEFHYIVTIDVTGGPAEIDVTLNLPAGFAFATNPVSGSPATFRGQGVSPTNNDPSLLQFTLGDVPAGSHQLEVAARAGLTTGSFTAFATASATAAGQADGAGPAEATVNVVEAFDDDGPGSTPPLLDIDGELQLAHVARSDDVDLYEFTVPEQGFEGASARVLLSNIPDGVDYDVTVFAPPVVPLRGTPTEDLSSLGDVGFDLDPTDDVYATDVVQDIPLTTPQDWLGVDAAVRGVSSRRSSADEEVKTATLQPGATYYVQVTSYNGGLSNRPYAIRLRVSDGTPLPECSVGPRGFPFAIPAPTPREEVDIPDGVNTLFVTNAQWLTATLGPDPGETSTADDVLAAVDLVAGSGINGVIGALVPVDAYGPVRAAYTTWQNNRCDPDARNGVVTAIGTVLDGIIAANPTVENIVIVGDDGIVPMAGVPDLTIIANETSFAPEVVTPNGDGTYSSNELSAALGAGLVLTDDPYATSAGILVGDHELFVPERNIGRLVETADQIVTSLEHFFDYDGELDPETFASALVTGYDFLSDGATDLKDALEADGLVVNATVPPPGLIGDSWDKDDLLGALATPGLDVISPNAHYDYESLLPALQNAADSWNQSDLVFVDDLAALSSDPAADTLNNLTRATIVVTMGCHAGLSVPEVQVGFAAIDWAETYASGNNPLLAQTTYGYGDSDLVALSERLTSIFAGNVSEMSVGEAVRFAKAEYLATTLVLNPYDEKILQSFTNYGLPMYVMGDGIAGAAASAEPAAAAEGPAIIGANIGGVTSVVVDLTVEDPGGSGPSNLNRITVAGEGAYYEVDGNILAAQYRPVQPLVDIELAAGSDARGFLITELRSQDETGFEPLYFRPSIDLSVREPRILPEDGSFPARLQRVTTYDTPGGERQRLLLTAGQFQSGLENDGEPNQDVERLFTHIAGDLYSVGADPTDTEGPLFSQAVGRLSEQGAEDVVQFEVDVQEAARCYVLFKLPFANQWQGVDLNQVGTSTTWLGAAPVPGGTTLVEFFVQCVDDNGNVSVTDNKVDNFLAVEVIESGSLIVDLSSPDGQQAGYFRGAVTPTVSGLPSPLPEDYAIEYSIDSQLPFLPGTVVGNEVTLPAVGGAGGHVILVQDSEGNREFRFFIIDDAPPLLTATAIDTSTSWAGQPVNVALSAVDVGQSGVASIEYSTATLAADGSITTTGPIAAASNDVLVTISGDGVTTVTATATDVAGNVSAAVTAIVRVDGNPPSVACAEPSAGWSATNQTVSCTVTDTGSGFSGSSTTTVDLSTDVAEGEETADASAGGPAGGAVTVADDAGLSVEVGPVPGFRIDRKGPEITVLGPDPAVPLAIGNAASVTYDCQDGGSGMSGGLAECSGTTAIDTSQPGPTAVTLAATDAVGNQTTVTVTYSVAYGVCLQYDPLKKNAPGSVVPIKLLLCDSAGANLSSRQLILTAVGIDDTSSSPPPNDAGQANKPFRFRYRNDGYIYNFDSDGIASGYHDFLFVVGDDLSIIYRAGFTIR